METKDNKKLGVWMDQSRAYLIACEDKQASLMEEVESPVESMVRYPGETDSKFRVGGTHAASNQEIKSNNIHQEQVKRYFSMLEEKLQGFEDILLLGPGVLKNQFLKKISSNKAFSKVKVHLQDADKMTTNQLLAVVRGHFSTRNST
jgi:hypothetical protein